MHFSGLGGQLDRFVNNFWTEDEIKVAAGATTVAAWHLQGGCPGEVLGGATGDGTEQGRKDRTPATPPSVSASKHSLHYMHLAQDISLESLALYSFFTD